MFHLSYTYCTNIPIHQIKNQGKGCPIGRVISRWILNLTSKAKCYANLELKIPKLKIGKAICFWKVMFCWVWKEKIMIWTSHSLFSLFNEFHWSGYLLVSFQSHSWCYLFLRIQASVSHLRLCFSRVCDWSSINNLVSRLVHDHQV